MLCCSSSLPREINISARDWENSGDHELWLRLLYQGLVYATLVTSSASRADMVKFHNLSISLKLAQAAMMEHVP